MKKLLFISLAVAMVLGIAGMSQATLTNGGFETGDFTGWATNAGSGASWAVEGTHTQGGYTTSPTDGNYMAYIYGGGSNTFSSNWLTQTFGVVDAQNVFFDYRVFLPDYPPFEQPGFAVELTADGSTSTIFSINDPGSGTQVFGWDTFTYNLGGYTGDLTLTFYCGNTEDAVNTPWAYIDSVGTDGEVPIPEPATMLLLGSGLVGLAGMGRRKLRENS